MRSKADGGFWLREVEEKDVEVTVGGRMKEDGEVAVGVETAGDGGAAGALDAQACGADGDASIGSDFDLGAEAPDVGPPGAVWGGAEDGAFFLEREVPGGLRGGAQFAVAFGGVVVDAEFSRRALASGRVAMC